MVTAVQGEGLFVPSLEELVLDKNSNYSTYVASFTERQVMPQLNKQTVKHGTMYFSKPDALLMDYSEPAGDYSLIFNGRFTAKRKGKVNRFEMDAAKKTTMYALRETLLGSLNGDLMRVARENETNLECQERDSRIYCTLVRKQTPQRGVCRLELEYDSTTGLLLVLRLTEVNGNYTEYVTHDGQTDIPIEPSVWER